MNSSTINISRSLDEFIKGRYGIASKLNHVGYTEMFGRVGTSDGGSLTFRPKNSVGNKFEAKIVLKPMEDGSGRLEYSKTNTAKKATVQFKKLIENYTIGITHNTGNHEETTQNEFPVIDTEVEIDDKPGLHQMRTVSEEVCSAQVKGR